jgi:hypothetical protein
MAEELQAKVQAAVDARNINTHSRILKAYMRERA